MRISLGGVKNDSVKFIPVTAQELASFKAKHHEAQKGRCPILKKEFPVSDMVVDHKHRKKGAKISPENGGLIRGVIHKNINQLEGAILDKYKRFGLQALSPLPEILRALADYLENPPLGQRYIHPNELPKPRFKKLSRRDFKLVLKFWTTIKPKAQKFPEYPASGQMIGDWQEWVAQAHTLLQAKKSQK